MLSVIIVRNNSIAREKDTSITVTTIRSPATNIKETTLSADGELDAKG